MEDYAYSLVRALGRLLAQCKSKSEDGRAVGPGFAYFGNGNLRRSRVYRLSATFAFYKYRTTNDILWLTLSFSFFCFILFHVICFHWQLDASRMCMSWCRGAAVGLRVGGQAYDSVAGQRVKLLGLITASGSFTLFGNRCFIEYRIRHLKLLMAEIGRAHV